MKMQLRRTLACSLTALALAAPLTSCGFDLATDRYYTPAAGANDREGQVDVLAAVVVSTSPGSGTFIASLSNNSTTEAASLTEIGSTEGQDVTAAAFSPVEVAPGQLVNLAEPPVEITLTGDFEAGNFVEIALGFDNGERTVLNVPVVPNSGDYEGLDGAPAEAESATESTS
jgi:hypothetical protein